MQNSKFNLLVDIELHSLKLALTIPALQTVKIILRIGAQYVESKENAVVYNKEAAFTEILHLLTTIYKHPRKQQFHEKKADLEIYLMNDKIQNFVGKVSLDLNLYADKGFMSECYEHLKFSPKNNTGTYEGELNIFVKTQLQIIQVQNESKSKNLEVAQSFQKYNQNIQSENDEFESESIDSFDQDLEQRRNQLNSQENILNDNLDQKNDQLIANEENIENQQQQLLNQIQQDIKLQENLDNFQNNKHIEEKVKIVSIPQNLEIFQQHNDDQHNVEDQQQQLEIKQEQLQNNINGALEEKYLDKNINSQLKPPKYNQKVKNGQNSSDLQQYILMKKQLNKKYEVINRHKIVNKGKDKKIRAVTPKIQKQKKQQFPPQHYFLEMLNNEDRESEEHLSSQNLQNENLQQSYLSHHSQQKQFVLDKSDTSRRVWKQLQARENFEQLKQSRKNSSSCCKRAIDRLEWENSNLHKEQKLYMEQSEIIIQRLTQENESCLKSINNLQKKAEIQIEKELEYKQCKAEMLNKEQLLKINHANEIKLLNQELGKLNLEKEHLIKEQQIIHNHSELSQQHLQSKELECKTLEQELTQLNLQKNQLIQQLKQIEEIKKNAKDKVNQTELTTQGIQNEELKMKKKREKIKQQKQKIQELEENNQASEKKLALMECNHAIQLEKCQQEAQSKLIHIQKRVGDFQVFIQQQQQQLEELANENSSLNKSISELNLTIKNQDQIIEQQKNDYKKKNEQKQEQQKQILQKIEMEFQKYKKKIELLQGQLKQKDAQFQGKLSLQILTDQSTALEQGFNVSQQQQILELNQQQYNDYNIKFQQLKNELSQQQSENQILQKKLQEMNDQNTNTKKEINQLQQQQQLFSQIKTKNQQINSELIKNKANLNQSNENLKNQQEQSDFLEENLQMQEQDKQELIILLKHEILNLQNQLIKETQKNSDLVKLTTPQQVQIAENNRELKNLAYDFLEKLEKNFLNLQGEKINCEIEQLFIDFKKFIKNKLVAKVQELEINTNNSQNDMFEAKQKLGDVLNILFEAGDYKLFEIIEGRVFGTATTKNLQLDEGQIVSKSKILSDDEFDNNAKASIQSEQGSLKQIYKSQQIVNNQKKNLDSNKKGKIKSFFSKFI